ncbi:MAG: efflux RND transporter permease subunit, partial [Planctomycetota bacterium]
RKPPGQLLDHRVGAVRRGPRRRRGTPEAPGRDGSGAEARPPHAASFLQRLIGQRGPVAMAAFFVDRPIVAMVLSIVLLIAGTVVVTGLPVAQFPEIR